MTADRHLHAVVDGTVVGGAPSDSPADGAPARTCEVTPGVFVFDQARHHLGPSATFEYIRQVLVDAATTGRPIRCHAPDFELLMRITRAAFDLNTYAVFTLHPDGDRADLTIHPTS